MISLAHPLVQSFVVPVTVCGAGLLLGRIRLTRPLAAAALVAALLACVLTMLGFPAWPARSGMQKLPLLLAAASVLAVALEAAPLGHRMRVTATCLFAVAGLLWLTWPALDRLEADIMAAAGAGVVATLVVVVRSASGLVAVRDSALMLCVAALGLAVTAGFSASLSLAQACVALSAAAGLAWIGLPVVGSTAGAPFMLGWGAVALALLAALVALLTEAPGWALAVLPLVFTASLAARRRTGAVRALLVGVTALILAGIMVGLSVVLPRLASGVADPYYR